MEIFEKFNQLEKKLLFLQTQSDAYGFKLGNCDSSINKCLFQVIQNSSFLLFKNYLNNFYIYNNQGSKKQQKLKLSEKPDRKDINDMKEDFRKLRENYLQGLEKYRQENSHINDLKQSISNLNTLISDIQDKQSKYKINEEQLRLFIKQKISEEFQEIFSSKYLNEIQMQRQQIITLKEQLDDIKQEQASNYNYIEGQLSKCVDYQTFNKQSIDIHRIQQENQILASKSLNEDINIKNGIYQSSIKEIQNFQVRLKQFQEVLTRSDYLILHKASKMDIQELKIKIEDFNNNISQEIQKYSMQQYELQKLKAKEIADQLTSENYTNLDKFLSEQAKFVLQRALQDYLGNLQLIDLKQNIADIKQELKSKAPQNQLDQIQLQKQSKHSASQMAYFNQQIQQTLKQTLQSMYNFFSSFDGDSKNGFSSQVRKTTKEVSEILQKLASMKLEFEDISDTQLSRTRRVRTQYVGEYSSPKQCVYSVDREVVSCMESMAGSFHSPRGTYLGKFLNIKEKDSNKVKLKPLLKNISRL